MDKVKKVLPIILALICSAVFLDSLRYKFTNHPNTQEIFGRLNVRHGPNVEQIVREFSGSNGEFAIEFDLSATRIHEARVERAWLDLIFEGPEMNEIILRDVTLSRRPRAEF